VMPWNVNATGSPASRSRFPFPLGYWVA
jgi:hypothetical protein